MKKSILLLLFISCILLTGRVFAQNNNEVNINDAKEFIVNIYNRFAIATVYEQEGMSSTEKTSARFNIRGDLVIENIFYSKDTESKRKPLIMLDTATYTFKLAHCNIYTYDSNAFISAADSSGNSIINERRSYTTYYNPRSGVVKILKEPMFDQGQSYINSALSIYTIMDDAGYTQKNHLTGLLPFSKLGEYDDNKYAKRFIQALNFLIEQAKNKH